MPRSPPAGGTVLVLVGFRKRPNAHLCRVGNVGRQRGPVTIDMVVLDVVFLAEGHDLLLQCRKMAMVDAREPVRGLWVGINISIWINGSAYGR